jgi:hypothetical protein
MEMASYKSFKKIDLGGSDVASLIVRTLSGDGTITVCQLGFGGDGRYSAYLIPDGVAVGEHYSVAAEGHTWMEIFDDARIRFRCRAETIRIFRGGDYGCIIQLLGQASCERWNRETCEMCETEPELL